MSSVATAINTINRHQLKKNLKRVLTTGKQCSNIVKVVTWQQDGTKQT